MPTGQHYATNVPQTTLQAGGVNSSATTAIVQSSASWPSTPFAAIFDIGQSNQEPVQVTNVSGTTWTITRAIDGTSPFTHSNGATVTFGVIGRDFTELRSHIDSAGPTDASSESVHGLTTGSVVGTSETQTLTNKTLTSPVIGTIVNTGTLTLPTSTDTLVGRATTDTLTNKTLTAPALSGTVTGTYTLGGTPTLTAPTINGGALSGTFSGAHTYSGLPTFSAGATVSNGQVLTLDNTLAQPVVGPTLHSWSPTVSGTSYALGNGTITASYLAIGKMIFFTFKLLRGSTTNWGTGATSFTVTLPVNANAGFACSGLVIRPAAADVALAVSSPSNAPTIFQLEYSDTSATTTTLSNTAPDTFSTNDYILVTGSYWSV